MTKSCDAVQQFVHTNGFRRLAEVDDVADEEDDGIASSVSSYGANEEDGDRDLRDGEPLADSSITIESDTDSIYDDSMSEDDQDGGHVRYRRSRQSRTRAWDGRRREAFPRSLHRRGEDILGAGVVMHHHYGREASGRQQHHPVQHHPLTQRRRASSPPRVMNLNNGAAAQAQGMGLHPAAGPLFQRLPPRWATNAGFGTSIAPQNGSGGYMQRPPVGSKPPTQHQQTPLIPPLGPLPSGPGPVIPLRHHTSQFFPTHNPFPPMPPMAANWTPVDQIPPLIPGQQRPKSMYQLNSSVKKPGPSQDALQGSPVLSKDNGNSKSQPTVSSQPTAPSASSATSTPTLIITPNSSGDCFPKPPLAPSPATPSNNKIDYRLIIKTFKDSNKTQQEHRIIARTPATRHDLRSVALRYISTNPDLFRQCGLIKAADEGTVPAAGVSSAVDLAAPIRTLITRVVFTVGKGREESYDLAAYPEDDFSKLCESMRGQGSAASEGVSGWPVFEVVCDLFSRLI